MQILREGKEMFVIAKDLLLDLIFPKECGGCGKEGEWLCDSCLAAIDINKPVNVCPICGVRNENLFPVGAICRKHNLNLDGLWIAANYNNRIIRRAIHNFKYNFIEDLHEVLVVVIGKYLSQVGCLNFDYVIPVPLHGRRRAERGFNQSELLARRIGENLNCPLNIDILKRKRYTTPQIFLDREGRKSNLINAFLCEKRDVIAGKSVVLVDDVCTTGSTLEECSKELKSAGASKVWGLVIAKNDD